MGVMNENPYKSPGCSLRRKKPKRIFRRLFAMMRPPLTPVRAAVVMIPVGVLLGLTMHTPSMNPTIDDAVYWVAVFLIYPLASAFIASFSHPMSSRSLQSLRRGFAICLHCRVCVMAIGFITMLMGLTVGVILLIFGLLVFWSSWIVAGVIAIVTQLYSHRPSPNSR